jgi:hypothetical protein
VSAPDPRAIAKELAETHPERFLPDRERATDLAPPARERLLASAASV